MWQNVRNSIQETTDPFTIGDRLETQFKQPPSCSSAKSPLLTMVGLRDFPCSAGSFSTEEDKPVSLRPRLAFLV